MLAEQRGLRRFLLESNSPMPLYEYQCKKCKHRFEKIQQYSDAPIKKCPKCNGPVEKLISAPAVQFKGSGFYSTDYPKSGSGGGSSSSKDSDSSSSESSASAAKESKSESSSEKSSSEKSSSSDDKKSSKKSSKK
jgi:putative FmdB family regulatory protein